MKDFAELMRTVHATAVDHGWWEKPPSTETIICLIHTEISEAFEEYRKWGLDPKRFIYYSNNHERGTEYIRDEHNSKPEGIAVELADVCIRLMDWCEAEGEAIEWPIGMCPAKSFEGNLLTLTGECLELRESGPEFSVEVLMIIIGMAEDFDIPLEQAIREKIAYNETRPYKHGGKGC